MKYNLRNAIFDESGAKQLENAGTQSEPQNPETSKDMHTGLTQELKNVCVKEFFHVAPGTILFLPDTAEKLYRVQVLEVHQNKIFCLGVRARRLVQFQINLGVFKIQRAVVQPSKN